MKRWTPGDIPSCDLCIYQDDEEACMLSSCEYDMINDRTSYFTRADMPTNDDNFALLNNKKFEPEMNYRGNRYHCNITKYGITRKMYADTSEELLHTWQKEKADYEKMLLNSGNFIRKTGNKHLLRYKGVKKSFDDIQEAKDYCRELIDYVYEVNK